ncbi:inositol-1-monophosphatase [Paraferrimonas sp. SM1919]|uniref:inositol-1-monophosphatase n=1 Tax=Paraferrimonas sp. SM1919 TaxID=2662263 RepID=UPI0013D8B340|nr:inositol-1-monophosphatase [Paraferrimonas sp. SM1919]
MLPMMTIAVRAARNAGNLIARAFEESDKVEVQSKGLNDFVTNIDKAAEEKIIETIRKSYPDHSIVGEELGQNQGSDTDYLWVIDPLDGTANFVRGIPHFAVSIALKVKGKTEVAVVYDPIRDELFSALRGRGAQLNGFRIRASEVKDLDGTIISTGFPFKNRQHSETYLHLINEMFSHVGDFRRSGSAALDLAYVAAGRHDGHFEIGLKPWDIAAGDLIAREAGATVTDFVGGHDYMNSGNIVAGSPKATLGLLKVMRPLLSEALKR